MRMVDEGVAHAAGHRYAVTLGLNYRWDPSPLMDNIGGLDLLFRCWTTSYSETKDVKWNSPHSLKSLVRAGRYGRKNGAGWYTYEPGAKA
jgi:3-hydroxybutyryl-CoA dehydrogenase